MLSLFQGVFLPANQQAEQAGGYKTVCGEHSRAGPQNISTTRPLVFVARSQERGWSRKKCTEEELINNSNPLALHEASAEIGDTSNATTFVIAIFSRA